MFLEHVLSVHVCESKEGLVLHHVVSMLRHGEQFHLCVNLLVLATLTEAAHTQTHEQILPPPPHTHTYVYDLSAVCVVVSMSPITCPSRKGRNFVLVSTRLYFCPSQGKQLTCNQQEEHGDEPARTTPLLATTLSLTHRYVL